MRLHVDGVTRTVLLVGRVAIKIPAVHHFDRHAWRMFLTGLLANIHERLWWREMGHTGKLCPVLFGDPFGFVIVMRRTEDLPGDYLPAREDFEGLPVDYKASSFGLLAGRVVLRDYGS